VISCLVHDVEDVWRVLVEDDGHPIAHVDVSGHGPVVDLRFSVNAGHLPVGARRLLVDAAFDLPLLKEPRLVHATLPLGDVDLLTGLRSHCTRLDTRAAGATCLVDGDVSR
jgi:hypothetical protein